MTPPSHGPLLQTEPGIATAEDGVVVLDGPNGVALTMTPEAAAQTGFSLISAAQTAEQQIAESDEADAS